MPPTASLRFVRGALLAIALATTGCVEGDLSTLPAASLAPSATLVLTELGEATPRRTWGLDVRGAASGDPIEVVVGNGGFGAGDCPGRLGGVCYGFLPGTLGYRTIFTGTADAAGRWTTTLPFPAAVASGDYQVQAIVPAGTASNESNVEIVNVRRLCRVDAAEPNETLATAASLAANSAGMVACAGEADWFTTTVPDAAFVELTVAHALTDGDVDVELYDARGNALDWSLTAQSDEVVRWFNRTGAPEPVFLRVFAFADNNGNGVGYDIGEEVVQAGVCPDDGFEDDDTPATARPVSSGTFSGHSCTDDSDWFSVAVGAGQVVFAEILEDFANGDVDLVLYDEALVAQNVQPEDSLSWTSSTAQTAFIEVVLSSDSAFDDGNAYELELQVATPDVCNDDAFEDDDVIADARVVGAGRHTAWSCLGDADWYRIDLAAGETLVLDVDEDFAVGNVDFRVYDDAGNELTNGLTDDFIYTASAAESLFVSLVLISDDGLGDGNTYDFVVDISVLTVCPTDFAEPNDVQSDAVRLGPGSYLDLGACLASDSDWFAIEVPAGDRLTVDIFFSDSDADLDLRLVDGSGDELDRSESVSDDESVSVRASSTETFYAEVYVWADDGGPTSGGAVYDLDITIQ